MLRKVETVLAALLLVRLGAVVCSKVTPAPVNNPDYQYLYKQTVSNAAARGALCNDGTPAVFYYRNCTANGDRRAGDPTNYCAKGGTQGVQSVQWFVYLDPADSLFCHDKQSCSHRPAQLQTSTGLPDRVFLSGWFSPYPEQNPNFYKQHSVYIPSCSSDLFVGTAGKDAGSGLFFGGRNIVRAVLEDLQALDMTFEGVAAPLVQADQVVIGGGAGAMLLLDSIRTWLPKNVTDVRAVCDGCVIPDIEPLGTMRSELPCKDDAHCPPMTSLRQAVDVWGFKPPAWCTQNNAAECFFGGALIANTPNMLVQAPQLNTVQLTQYGASTSARSYAAKYAAAIRKLAATAKFSFSVGCQSNGTSLMTSQFYYFDQLNCTTSNAPPFPFALTGVMGEFLSDPTTTELHCVDPQLQFQNCSGLQ